MNEGKSWDERHLQRNVRRFVLALNGLIFLLFALYAVVSPHGLAKSLDYQLPSANALSEFRAIYVGLCGAMGLLFLQAARRIEETGIADALGVIYVGLGCGRFFALAVDGVPGSLFIAAGVFELVSGFLILALRPR